MVRYLAIVGFLMASYAGFSQTYSIGDYKTSASGTTVWTTATNWQICTVAGSPGTFVAAGSAPASGGTGMIYINRAMATSTATTTFSIAKGIIVNSGITLTISNSVNSSSSSDLTIAAGAQLTNGGTIIFATSTTANPGILTVNGTLTNSGTINLTTATNTAPKLILSGTAQSNSGTISLSTTSTAALTVSTSLTNTGTISIGSGIATVSGTVTNSNTWTSSGGTTSISGTFNNSASSNLNFTGGTNTVTGTLNSAGNISSGTLASPKLTFADNSIYNHQWTTANGSIPIATWTSDLDLNGVGSSCQISSLTTATSAPGNLGQTFYDLTWNTPGLTSTINLGGSLTTVNGGLTISSTGSGSLFLAQLQSGDNQLSLTVGKDFVISGSSSVNFTQDQTFGAIAVGGSFNHSSSSAVTAGTTTGAVSLTVNKDFLNASAFNGKASTVTLQGGTSEDITGTIDILNITVVNGSVVSNDGDVSLRGSLTLSGTGDSFSANGSGGGTLTLLSTLDKPAADGSIATIPSDASFTGIVTVQRYMGNSNGVRMFRYLSSPVTSATVADWQDDFSITGLFTGASTTDPSNGSNVVCGFTIIPSKASMDYYDAATQKYVPYPTTSSSAPLVPGVGYSAQIRDCTTPVIIDVTGQINQGDQVFSPVYNTGDAFTFNLVGNPYPSAIDWGSVDLSAGGISSVVYVTDNAAGNTTGLTTYHVMDNTDGPGLNFIATGQAFWTSATAASSSFTLTEANKAAAGSSYSFYRTAPTVIKDKLTISMTSGAQTDQAFVKLNPAAANSHDRFDGPKLANSFFNITTVSADSVQMAVNALNTLACGTSIPVKISNMAVGNYSMSFVTAGRFNGYNLTLQDSYTHTNTVISSQPYSFMVTSATASKSANRFKILVAEKTYSLALPVIPTLNVCGTDDAIVSISDSEAAISYVAQMAGISVSDTLAGNLGTLNFKIASAKLSEGTNTVTFVAIGNCSSGTLSQSSIVTKNALYTPGQLNSTTACNIGKVTLGASGAPSDGHYNWYAANEVTPIAGQTGATYVTDSLSVTTPYYVSVVNSLGCEGPKVEVDAKVNNYNNASITAAGINKIQSNYAHGNRWYVNGVPLPDTTSVLTVTTTGTYRLEVTVGSCTTSTESVENLVAAIEGNDLFKGYPNPVQSVYSLELPIDADSANEFPVFNSQGSQVGKILVAVQGNVRKGSYDFSTLSTGLYLIRVSTTNSAFNVKVVKK